MTMIKTTPAQRRFLEGLDQCPDFAYPYPNATMKALIKKGIIEVDEVKVSKDGTRFKTYRKVAA
jgi:hypothetical protein